MAQYKFKYILDGKERTFEVKSPTTQYANSKFVNFLILEGVVDRENVLGITRNSLKSKQIKSKELDFELDPKDNPFIKQRKGKELSKVLNEKSNHRAYNY
jgi:hypothetical protein